MKSAPITFFAAGASLIAITAAAAEERSFDLPEFDSIDISAGIAMVATVGEAQTVRVETDNGDFRDFKIKVKNGELTITREWNRLRWHGSKSKYKVIVAVRDLKSLDASSGSHAKIVNIDAEKFYLDISSGAHATVLGACSDCVLDLSSGAHLDGKELACDDARIDVSSGAHGKISVSNSVVADASSGGHVSVYGNPEKIDVDKSSGGRIKIISGAVANRD